MKVWPLLLGLVACAPRTSPSAIAPASIVTPPEPEPTSTSDHIEAELGFRLRLPPGCSLARAKKAFVGLGTPIAATWLGCAHELGRLDLWIVEHHRVAAYGVEGLIDYIRDLPVSMPMHDPLAAELHYWGAATTDEGLPMSDMLLMIGALGASLTGSEGPGSASSLLECEQAHGPDSPRPHAHGGVEE